MRKIYWSTLSDTEVETDGNHIKIKGDPEEKLEVSVIDNNGDKVKRFLDVKPGEQKVLITMKFQWEISDNYKDTDTENIEYIIKKNDDCWKIDKDKRGIIVKNRTKYEEAVKEMHKKLLEEEFKDEVGNNSKKEAEGIDMKYTILKDGRNGYKVKIYKDDTNDDWEFPWERVKIEPSYYGLTKGLGFNDLHEVKYQEEEKKSPWTTGWIIFFVILGVVLVLMIAFWKKIWRWIKGEREQEKKVKEQLDIF